MRLVILLTFVFLCIDGESQVVLTADGPGNTYSLINSVLAPGYNAIETPDCGHNAFGNHIDEVFDSELNKYVFRFSIHTTPDDDRCINFDRQRNEIKTYDQSPDNLLGVENETVRYQWAFKLPAGFQSSSRFTHIHQLKSVGDPYSSMPMYTLTTREGNPDQLELRYAEFGSQVTLVETDLAPFMGTWVDVTETIEYSNPGSYSIEMKQVSDSSILFSYSNNSIANWRVGATFLRPKWGIYRSLAYPQALRDEEVLFAGFSVEEISLVSQEEDELAVALLKIFPNPANKKLTIRGIPKDVLRIQIYDSNGNKLTDRAIRSQGEIEIDVSLLLSGVYAVRVVGDRMSKSQIVFID